MSSNPGTRAPFDPDSARRTVFQALIDAQREWGGGRIALVDGDDRALSYDEIIRASFALGSALKAGTRAGECVGVMLPTGAAGALTFFALSAFGRIPTMLNFTAGVAGLKSALRTALVKRVITAHRLVELAGLEELIAGLTGTEGEPKGVALSHENLLVNVAQVRSHVGILATDVIFNPLPVFHCFGLTGGTILPLIAGIRVICHPSPKQPKEIVRRIRQHGATILLSTDTFINQYARTADDGEMASLRMAVCGAERLRDETRAFVRRKTGITLLEGYGVTETAPVVAVNQIETNRPGTVGQLMPGMEARLEPVEGIPGAGRLFLRGPNVMLGYIKPDAPGRIVPPEGGWHDTGDVVSIDEDGFIAIRGRLKRFAKIGGETVSLAVVENIAAALWPDNAHAAVTVPDGRKGEQIVLITDARDVRREKLIAWARNHGVSELSVPRRVVMVESIPLLATGKTDYVTVQKLAESDPKIGDPRT